MTMRAEFFRWAVQTFSLVSLLSTAFILTGAELPTEDPDEGELHPLLAKVINIGPYQPKWASLVTHPLPDWFQDSKIGLSAHWGPYAVPGWTPRKDTPYGVAYAEWYWEWMKNNQAVKDYHAKHYGDAVYDDFLDGTKNLVTGETDGFFAKDFDADGWMRLFKDAGVKYFFITSKHHDGFCIWDSKYTDRNAAKMGPRRDLYGEMVAAARKHGLRVGLYYSFYEWNNPIYRGQADISGYRGCKPLADQDGDGKTDEYVDDFMVPQIKELIDTYHPDYLCFDGEWEHGYLHWRARQIVAYYFNQAAARGQEVVINDRFGQKKEGTSDTRGVYGDFYHVEYHANIDRTKPWAMWRGFGNSYGYNRNEHPDNILSVKDTIKMILDCAAEGGNIEFNIGPKADGTLAEFEVERLKAMGQWLKVNGEGVYHTRRGPIQRAEWGVSTINGNRLYLHVVEWPEDNILSVKDLASSPRQAYFLHEPQRQLATQRSATDGLTIDLSNSRPFAHASTLCLKFDKPPEVPRSSSATPGAD